MATKKNARNPRRHPVTQQQWPFHTTSEAQGEAAWVAMRALLKRIPRSMCKSIMAECYSEADSAAVDAVTEEIETLFWGIDFRDAPKS